MVLYFMSSPKTREKLFKFSLQNRNKEEKKRRKEMMGRGSMQAWTRRQIAGIAIKI